MRQSFFLIKLQEKVAVIKKESLAQVFSCEFCEIFKEAFFIERLRWLCDACYWINELVICIV